jgi:hypothetical protein
MYRAFNKWYFEIVPKCNTALHKSSNKVFNISLPSSDTNKTLFQNITFSFPAVLLERIKGRIFYI